MRKLQTLFKEFINAPIQIYSGATFKKGLYDLLDVYSNTESGDLVIVKGNHNVGDNSIQLKDGVNWEFKGMPRITSTSTDGIFKDGGIPVEINFDGRVEIQNLTNIYATIILENFDSNVYGYTSKYSLSITIEEDVPAITVQNNDMRIANPTVTFASGYLTIVFPEVIKTNSYISSRFKLYATGGSDPTMFVGQDDEKMLAFRSAFMSTTTVRIEVIDIATASKHLATLDAFTIGFYLERIFDKSFL